MTTDESIAARLRMYIDACGMTNSQFADTAGIPRPTLSQLLTGRNKSVNDQFLRKLNDAYPSLDIRWLLFGTGSMGEITNSAVSEAQNSPNPSTSSEQNAELQVETTARSLFDESPQKLSEKYNGAEGGENEADASSRTAEPFIYEARPLSHPHVQGQDVKNNPKKIESIIIFYSDNSFETFRPAD